MPDEVVVSGRKGKQVNTRSAGVSKLRRGMVSYPFAGIGTAFRD